MPNMPVADYLAREIGIDIDQHNRTQSSQALIQAAQGLGNDLSNVLYKAIVQLDGNLVLEGPPLSPKQLLTLKEAAKLARRQPTCPVESRGIIKDFEGAARRYASFLTNDHDDSSIGCEVLNKQLTKAKEWETHATPRHSLTRRGNEVYEILTWMTPEETTRVENRFPNTNGLYSLASERSRNRTWGNEDLFEHKITLGSGSFGAARIARRVSDDQYMAYKKVHPQNIGPRPAQTPIVRGVNDGSASGISRVYDSYMGHSTRGGGAQHTEPSAYTLSELGIIDTHKFINIFSVMCYALNPEYETQELARTLRASMRNGSDALTIVSNARRLESNPCKNPETVRRFRNTFAYQMLEAVHQMHQKGRAHNDIKPDNFVLAYDEKNLLRIKLIDFDMNASVKETIGRPRDVYAAAFSAPQVSSDEANNQADRNDAYSMGCSLRLLNGEPLDTLLLKRKLAKGEIRDKNNKTIKPVEDRRVIESRFLHIPEWSSLHDIIGLLSHPHSGKRYTIQQAMRSPLFTQPNNMLSAEEFSAAAEKIVRHGYLIPKVVVDQLAALQQCEKVLAQQNNVDSLGPMASALSSQDDQLLLKQYIQTHGMHKFEQALQKVKGQVAADNRSAFLRRGLRQLNISHHHQSAAEREANYVYKSPKK